MSIISKKTTQMSKIYNLTETPTYSFIFDYTNSTCSINSNNAQIDLKSFHLIPFSKLTYAGSILNYKVKG